MIRLIKRYESRKLYDTEESRYVSLEEISEWIREGQEVRVVENASSNDVTAQTLTQIILELGRSGRSRLPNELLHELIRLGERAWSSGFEQVQQGVERLIESSMERFGPVRRARDEMGRLRGQLRELERSLAALETQPAAAPAAAAPAKKTPVRRTAAKKPAAKKPAPKKPAPKRLSAKKPAAKKPPAKKPPEKKPAAKAPAAEIQAAEPAAGKTAEAKAAAPKKAAARRKATARKTVAAGAPPAKAPGGGES